MIEIELTKGKVTTVPDAVADYLNKDKWCASKHGNRYYAIRNAKKHERIDGKPRHIYMHRVVWEQMIGTIPEGMEIDHIDGNPLNNLIQNLRCIPRSDNRKNRANQKNASGHTGVYEITAWREGSQGCRWYVQHGVNGKFVYRGSFHEYVEACAVADHFRNEHLGEFIRKEPQEVLV